MIITPEDLAEMLGISRKTVIDRYSKQPGFPAPAEPQRQAAANGLRWSRTA